ncbi:hypothetical protein GM658_07715 [Pseudoduganella eburnea]|uniref:DUF4304 domain-containing protein n=1 Tax=Massilia eburnea TaxID=1776165 RepID=A0A6L6QE63_9BURK|nr:hypothetical protein [Massilia eburnea]MTW10489.1 hypothetical protein [Massilia eburnea]
MGFHLTDMIARLLPAHIPPQTMPRKTVRMALVEALQPLLAAHGFAPFKGTIAWRRSAHWIDVVEIGFIDTVTARRDSPILEVGRYFTFAPPNPIGGPMKEVDGQLYPSAAECHLRKVMFHFKRPKDTTWVVCNEQDLLDCRAEARRLIAERAFPWFAWLENLHTVLHLLREGNPDIEGNSRDPLRRGTWNNGGFFSGQVITGMVAFQLKQWALCRELLDPVLQRGGILVRNANVVPLPLQTLAMIRNAAEEAKRAPPPAAEK